MAARVLIHCMEATGTPGYPDGVIAQKSTYNTHGWLTTQTDGNGHETIVAYDAAGRVVKVTRSLTGTTGDLTWQYDYDAFGNQVELGGNDENPFRYCGEYLDLETNTYYLRAKNYTQQQVTF